MNEITEIFDNTKQRMEKSIESLIRELSSVRTGRASTGLVENISVDYYGTPTPMNQISSISIPEARLITIQPWDHSALIEIEKALLQSTPCSLIVRLIIALTEENTLLTVLIVIPFSNNQSRNFPASDDE